MLPVKRRCPQASGWSIPGGYRSVRPEFGIADYCTASAQYLVYLFSYRLENCLHSLYPRPFNIVCTSDGFVGKEWLMRHLGCIPTQKFVSDLGLVRDMLYAVRELHSSVLMYPEASYSFDGTATPLPEGIGKCVKMLGVPLVMIHTYGAFARDPLYNGLQLRKVYEKTISVLQ